MIIDQNISEKVGEILNECNDYLMYIDDSDPGVYSDRMIERIIEKADELKSLLKEARECL